jgi:pyruvate kinase
MRSTGAHSTPCDAVQHAAQVARRSEKDVTKLSAQLRAFEDRLTSRLDGEQSTTKEIFRQLTVLVEQVKAINLKLCPEEK